MKKVKKILMVLALVLQTLSLAAEASQIDTFQYAAGNVTVKGTSTKSVVTYKVYDKSSSETALDGLCEMGEAEVADGKFEINFKMPKSVGGEETEGEYVFVVMGEDRDTKEFEVIAYSTLESFVDKVNDAGITSGSDLVELFDGIATDSYTNLEIMKSLGADTDYYRELGAEKEKFANAFFAENADKSVNCENFTKLFTNAKTVQYINKNKADLLWLSESEFEFEGESFADITDEALKNWILESVNSVITATGKYDSYSEIEKKYREANVVYVLNKVKHTEYDEKLALYDDVIEILDKDYYLEYLNMKPSYKNSVNAEVKNSVASKTVMNAEDFKDRYKAAVEKVKLQIEKDAAGSRPSSGGGGGGGGSSSGGSSSKGGMTMISPEPSNPVKEQAAFGDLANVDWAKTAIEGLAEKGIIAGYDDNTFKPQKNITREEFVKMVVAAKGDELNMDSCGLVDVDQNAWYAPYVNAAYHAGYVKGISEKEFGIGKEITREDMAVIIARLGGYADAETKGAFSDDSDISDYAKDAVYSLYSAGKIAGIGDNMFGPKQIVNRAQAAKIIYDTLFSGM